jgi:Tol biopolymer transport system component
MAYSRLNTWTGIWAMPVPARGPVSIRGATQISTGNETTEDVDVSPDGRWLVFDSDRGGNADLYVMPTAGGEARRITDDPAGDYSGDWSPNGQRILFHSLRAGSRNIYTVDADGTGLQQWTEDSAENLDADWAPDGQTILYEVIGSRHGFGILRLTGGAQVEFLDIPLGDFAHWSPDGKRIVYHAVEGLRLYDIATGADTLLTSNAADGAKAYYAAWAPDGRQLYYLARSPAGWVIRVVSATGGPSRVLVDFDDPTRQHAKYGFATDGKVFYFTLGSPESDIFVAELERP